MFPDLTFRPSVLVVMPLYNAEKYVEKAIRSILSQTYLDYAVLIINDGSTDNSSELVKPFLRENIMMVTQRNSGPGVAMNFGIRFAYDHKIPYMARMDADDISSPNRLETLLKLITTSDRIAACSSNSHYIHAESEEIIGTSRVPSSSRLIRWEIFHGLRGLIQGACLFRTEALQQVGGYRPVFIQAEDTDLFLRLAERFDLANSPEFLYQIRLNPDSLSVKHARQSVLYQIYALDCSYRRRRKESEHNFITFVNSLNVLQRTKVWRELKMLHFWREYLIDRSLAAVVLASALTPSRVLARILRLWDKKS